MKNAYVLIIALLLHVSCYSQKKINNNEIVAEGRATIKIKPDMAAIDIRVSKSDSIESRALSELNKEMQNIIATLEKIGFTKVHIRVADYSVSENHDRSGKYIAQNSLKLDFKLNNSLINNFYQQLELAKPSHVTVFFNTYLSEELKNESDTELLRQAIKDAKINALEIATALGVKLGSVKYASKSGYRERQDEYGKKLQEVVVTALSIEKTSFANYDVEEKKLDDQITLVFNIDKN
jgi:uncharacterized protein YggE